jgi:hypothetical protein
VAEQAWLPLTRCLALPDPNDNHVLAAAIAGHADCIVTTNTKDFPPELLTPHGVHAIHPDDFIVNQWDLDPVVVIGAFKGMRARWKRPSAAADDFARALERNGLAATAARLRHAAGLI